MKLQSGSRWFAAAAILAAVANVSGQSAVPTRQDDVLSALLVEVKGLRAAMEQLASAGPRVQLFASRLQLQEGRMNAMARRLDTVRDNLAAAQRQLVDVQGEEQRLQAAVNALRASASPQAREEAEMTESLLGQVRRQLGVAKATTDRHAAEETQLVADLTTEQGRWVEINGRLDELEKALGRIANR